MQLMEKIAQQQQASNQRLMFGVLAAGLIISSTLLLNQGNILFSSISGIAAVLCFAYSVNK